MITIDQLNKIDSNNRAQRARRELVRALNEWGPKVNLDQPHRVAMFLANVMHEAGGGRYLKERWGPTAAQRRYEGREDLGNTQSGDGKRFMGHGWIQTTGRANHRAVTTWARSRFPDVPDFEKNPERLAEPQWAAMSAFQYWSERVPSRYVDSGNHEMVRRRINGRLNGYSDVLDRFDRTAMVMLGFDPDDRESVKTFQTKTGRKVDGRFGPDTRGALFRELHNRQSVVTQPAADYVLGDRTLKPASKPKRKGGGWMNWILGG